MVSYTVTAELVKAHGKLNQNGDDADLAVDIPIIFTTTQATLVEAKQKAREGVNLQAAAILQEKIIAASLSPAFAGIYYKGRIAVDVNLWMSVNITSVTINP